MTEIIQKQGMGAKFPAEMTKTNTPVLGLSAERDVLRVDKIFKDPERSRRMKKAHH